MLLAVDIGNTNISFGIFKQDKFRDTFKLSSRNYFREKLRNKLSRLNIDHAIICSVVPQLTPKISRDLKAFTGKQAYIIGKDVKVPIKNLYRRPQEVGQDRLVNAYAGIRLYGAPLIIIDFGTAITFDIISRRKEYLGGMILPGLQLCLEALNQGTVLLPKIKLAPPKEFIGRQTKTSMLSGIVHGFGSLSDALVCRIKEKIGKQARVIATGGDIALIRRYCRCLDASDKDLTLKGLEMIFTQKNT